MSQPRAISLLVVGFVLLTGGRSARGEPPARTDHYGDPLPEGAVARLGTVRFRHPFWVSGLAFAPDGKTLASSCWDGTVRLWAAASGQETRSFRQQAPQGRPQQHFLGVRYTPDGKMLIAAESHTVHIWDLATGRERLLSLGRYVFGVALSPDGTTLAIGHGGDRAAQQLGLWDVTTATCLREFGSAARPVSAIAFASDGKTLASGDGAPVGVVGPRPQKRDSAVRLWDVSTGQQIRELKGHMGGVTAVAFSPDGRTLVSASHDASIRLWDPATGKQVRCAQVPDETAARDDPEQVRGIHYGGVLAVSYSPDGRLLVTGSCDGTVRVWDQDAGQERHALRGHGREVTSVAFSPDGKVLASAGFDHSIRLWDLSSGKPVRLRQGHDGPIWGLNVSPDGRLAAVCGDRSIGLWSLETGQQLHTCRGHQELVYSVAFSPDGRMLASASADRTIRLWDTKTGREARRLTGHDGAVYTVAFASAWPTLLSGGADRTVRVWDASTGKELRQIPGADLSHALEMSPDGRVLACADDAGIRLLDAATSKELRRITSDRSAHRVLTRDGRILVTHDFGTPVKPSLSHDTAIRLWSVATGAEVGAITDQARRAGTAGVPPFVLSPDGRLLARVEGRQTIQLLELATGKVRRRFHGHQGRVGPLAFTADGKTLLSGSEDTTVLVWDVARRHDERPDRLSAAELQDLWPVLAAEDAEQADVAVCTLAAAATQSVPFLERQLAPARAVDDKQLAGLIADLDSDQFATREQARQTLEKMELRAESALRLALGRSPSTEARRRIEGLLSRLRASRPEPDLLRSLRALEVLERIGSAEAKRLLQSLASGAPEARLTLEVKASLKRLGKRAAAAP